MTNTSNLIIAVVGGALVLAVTGMAVSFGFSGSGSGSSGSYGGIYGEERSTNGSNDSSTPPYNYSDVGSDKDSVVSNNNDLNMDMNFEDDNNSVVGGRRKRRKYSNSKKSQTNKKTRKTRKKLKKHNKK